MFPTGKVDITSWQSHVLGALTPLYNFLDLVGDIFSVGIVVTLILTWGKQVLNMTMAAKALHYLFGCSWQLLWACLPKFPLQTTNIHEHKTVRKRSEKRKRRKAKKYAKREVKREIKANELKWKADRKLQEKEDKKKQQEEEQHKANRSSVLSPDVEDLFRVWLEKSVTESLQTDGALSAAMSITNQPTRSSVNNLAMVINEASKHQQFPAALTPLHPPPPRVDSLSVNNINSEATTPVYEAFEAASQQHCHDRTPEQ